MSLKEQWTAIASRIRGLAQAGALHAELLKVRDSDMFDRTGRLRAHCADVLESIEAFRGAFHSLLPPAAPRAIERILGARHLVKEGINKPAQKEGLWSALVQLVAFEAELSFFHLFRKTEDREGGEDR